MGEDQFNTPFWHDDAVGGVHPISYALEWRPSPQIPKHPERARRPHPPHRHMWGTRSVNDCMTERDWTPDEIAAMEGLSFAIGDAIDRAVSDAHVSDVIRLTRPSLSSAGVSVAAARSRTSR
jgi:hypothetical protein